MNLLYDARQLTQLASGLQRLCGIPAGVRASDGRSLCDEGPRADFCERLRALAAGDARCADCRACPRTEAAAEGARVRRCHAGLLTAALPILGEEQREPLAWLCAGPFLNEAPVEEQWRAASASLGVSAAGAEELRVAFGKLRRLSGAEQAALAAMLGAMADSIRLRGLILPSRESDLRRLERFLDEHYTEKLSLASVSAQLHIGRTRLCALAKELSGGQTLFSMIARRRIDAAKALLVRTDRPVSAIAEAVGISDYNYFSKIFRAAVGVSPSKFRKQARQGLDDLV